MNVTRGQNAEPINVQYRLHDVPPVFTEVKCDCKYTQALPASLTSEISAVWPVVYQHKKQRQIPIHYVNRTHIKCDETRVPVKQKLNAS